MVSPGRAAERAAEVHSRSDPPDRHSLQRPLPGQQPSPTCTDAAASLSGLRVKVRIRPSVISTVMTHSRWSPR